MEVYLNICQICELGKTFFYSMKRAAAVDLKGVLELLVERILW